MDSLFEALTTNGLLAFFLVFLIFALGDVISYYTKSIVSSMFTISVVFLLLFWAGLNSDIFEVAGIYRLGTIAVGLLIVHMGTLLAVEDFIKQYKTVLVAVFALAGIGVVLYTIGPIFIDRTYAIAAAPPISGGVVAAIIMGDEAVKLGQPEIQVFVTLLVAVQGFIGFPVASFILNREAKEILARGRSEEDQVEIEAKPKLIPPLKEDLQTSYVLLTKLAFVALIGSFLGSLPFKYNLHTYVWCLFLGVFFHHVGFLESAIMSKSNSLGIGMGALMSVIFAPLANATPQLVGQLIYPLAVSLILGTIGIVIFSTLGAKVLNISVPMAIGIGSTALFGFPGTYIISNEVAKANGKTEEERQMILGEIMPKMLVAGFATVTIGSVVLAGIMVNFL